MLPLSTNHFVIVTNQKCQLYLFFILQISRISLPDKH